MTVLKMTPAVVGRELSRRVGVRRAAAAAEPVAWIAWRSLFAETWKLGSLRRTTATGAAPAPQEALATPRAAPASTMADTPTQTPEELAAAREAKKAADREAKAKKAAEKAAAAPPAVAAAPARKQSLANRVPLGCASNRVGL